MKRIIFSALLIGIGFSLKAQTYGYDLISASLDEIEASDNTTVIVHTNEAADLEVKVRPNPVENTLSLGEGKGEFNYEIRTENGIMIIDGISYPVNRQVNVTELVPGTYYLIVRQNGSSKALRFIKA